MGIHIVTVENIHSYADAMEQAYRLRHTVFVEEMGWNDLRKPDGREIDQFDDGRAVHMLYLEGDRLKGYQRMLPSMRPHLLSEVLPHLCDGELPVGPAYLGVDAVCVSKDHRDRGRMLSPAGNTLLSVIVEGGLESGICIPSGDELMRDDEDDKRPSNVIDLIMEKSSAPARLTSSAIIDGLELTKVFLTIRSAAERERVLRMVREIADSDARNPDRI